MDRLVWSLELLVSNLWITIIFFYCRCFLNWDLRLEAFFRCSWLISLLLLLFLLLSFINNNHFHPPKWRGWLKKILLSIWSKKHLTLNTHHSLQFLSEKIHTNYLRFRQGNMHVLAHKYYYKTEKFWSITNIFLKNELLG